MPLEYQLVRPAIAASCVRCRILGPVKWAVETRGDAGFSSTCTDNIHAGAGAEEQS